MSGQEERDRQVILDFLIDRVREKMGPYPPGFCQFFIRMVQNGKSGLTEGGVHKCFWRYGFIADDVIYIAHNIYQSKGVNMEEASHITDKCIVAVCAGSIPHKKQVIKEFICKELSSCACLKQ